MSDWRFNEFANAPAHALYVTCVELLSLPVGPTAVANNIIDVIVKGYTVIPQNEIHGWINVVGLLLTALPKCYWSVIYDRLQDVMKSDKMTDWPYRFSPFEMFNFKSVTEAMIERKYVLLLAVAHSILHHSSIGQMITIVEYVFTLIVSLIYEKKIQGKKNILKNTMLIKKSICIAFQFHKG